MSYLLIIYIAVYAVINLVSEATYRLMFSDFPHKNYQLFPSIITQEFADIYGIVIHTYYFINK